jgi:hypothetical protein
MEKVQKPSNSECYTPLSESFRIYSNLLLFFFSLALQPPWPLASDFQFHDNFTDGKTPCTSNRFVVRFLPKHRTTQTQIKHIHIPNIRVLCGFRTHDRGFRTSEDSTCLRPLDYPDRPLFLVQDNNSS